MPPTRCPIENFVRIAVPLHHPEDTYTFMFTPEYPGEMVIEVVSSRHVTIADKDEDTPKVRSVKAAPVPVLPVAAHVPPPFSPIVPKDTPSPCQPTKRTSEPNAASKKHKRPREVDPNDDSPTEPESEDIPNQNGKENTFCFQALPAKRACGESTKKPTFKYEKPTVASSSGRK